MSKVIVLGAGGMLGKQVVHFALKAGHEVFAADRQTVGSINAASLTYMIENFGAEILVNCIGVIPEKIGVEYPNTNTDMVYVNAFLPYIIKDICSILGVRMIQVSTDCVFSGKKGDYKVTDMPDPIDLYGRTKLVGEVGDLIVRTSFIGFEHGLLSWLVSNKGGSVEGYKQAYWSGSTVYEVARKMVSLLDSSLVGTIHLATISPITKCEVLLSLNDTLALGINIKLVNEPKIDRSLKPSHLLLSITSLAQELWDGYLSRYTSRA